MAATGPLKRNMKPIVLPSSAPSPTSLRAKASFSTLLGYYETPGVAPPSARVDPKHKAELGPQTRLWQIWKYGAVAAGKGIEVAGDILSHHIYGPRKKSWGIEMTIISSVMRGVGRHSHLVDIAFIRQLMSISGLMPLPSDALVSPVTFRVRKRNLRGILADYDALETGKRQLAGEWVVGKRLWRRLQSEWRAGRGGGQGGSTKSGDKKRKESVVLYVHGGAYYMFDATTHRLLTIPLSKHIDARVFAINYRLAPETKFPGPLHDVVSSYFRLIDDLRIPSENIIVAGDSAGGALCLALLMYLRDNQYPLPAGGIFLSPWVDLTMSCDSWDSNALFDVVPRPRQGDHLDPITCYLGEHMEEYLTHPYASPLFGDFKGLPPMLIQAGDAEVLRDEITLLAHKATLAGVDVRHELYEDAVHVFQAFPFLESSRKAFAACREFKNSLPLWQRSTPKVLDCKVEKYLAEEIDNDEAKMVDGDGLEVTTTDDSDISWSRDSSAEREDEDAGQSSQEEYPSWGQKGEEHPWPSPPVTDDEDISNPSSFVPPTIDDPDAGWQSPLRLLTSTISSIVETTSNSLGAKGHRRSPSLQHRPTHERRSSYHYSPPVMMESVQRPAPRPLLRRTTHSHPDISSLCQDWASSGPANQTVNYKSIQAQSLRPRRNSQARSVVELFSLA